jgi:hypothetical protein
MTDKTQSKLKVTQADRDAAAEVALLPCPHCSAIPQPYSTRDDGLWFQHPVGACVLSKFRFSSLCAYLWNTRTPSVSSEATYRMNADEHDAMFQAQMDSVEVRGQLSRPSSEASELVERSFQQRVAAWMDACFGPEISNDKLERNDRFIEEALELAQATGYDRARAHALVDYVFNRPAGEPIQEAGGVMVTLAALCLAHGMDMDAAAETELARIWTKVDAIRAKQASKPVGSALPIPVASLTADHARDKEVERLREAAFKAWNTWEHSDCDHEVAEVMCELRTALGSSTASGDA